MPSQTSIVMYFFLIEQQKQETQYPTRCKAAQIAGVR